MTFVNNTSTSRTVHILAISGSLRQVSSNTALLQAAIALLPEGVEMKLYGGLDNLPHFNLDLEPTEPPPVTELRSQGKRISTAIDKQNLSFEGCLEKQQQEVATCKYRPSRLASTSV